MPEDKDDPKEPNIFTIPIPQHRITLAHVHQYFPLKGTYTFRFKIAFDALVVWLDVNNMNQTLPTFKNQIHLKANRLSWQESKVIPQAPAQVQHPVASKKVKESVNIFDHHDEPPKQKEVKKNGANFGEFEGMNLLDEHSPNDVPHASSNPVAASS